MVILEGTVEEELFIFSPTLGEYSGFLSSDARLLAYDAADCISGYRAMFAGFLAIDRPSGAKALLIPAERSGSLQSAYGVIGELTDEYWNYPEGAITELLESFSKQPIDFINFPDSYRLIGDRASEWALLRYISSSTQGLYTFGMLPQAFDDLFSMKLRDSSFFGVTAPLKTILLIGPFVFLGMNWILLRTLLHVERLGIPIAGAHDYLIISDVSDLEGGVGAFVYSLIPYSLSVLMLIFFASANRSYGLIFGYLVEFKLDLSIEISDAPPRGWLRDQSIFQIVSGFTLLWSAIVSLYITERLWDIMVRARRPLEGRGSE